ncbi:hypothetical protein JRQ81_018146 [Phrynocephalus forsythii]|uniref:Uncharacterized protein n=1 Tax=Phrynocephalus forsythii TaxID=171643 RepID=A0A9Q0XRN4_9SAUR|nr:hypothetical protein JRQ81_018146 [Phrynocephalus forsythii]
MARLAPGSLLLLAVRSAGVLGELEGELRAAYLELHIQALPADLGADEGLQRVARDAADTLRCHHDGARLQRLLLLLLNNAKASSAGMIYAKDIALRSHLEISTSRKKMAIFV